MGKKYETDAWKLKRKNEEEIAKEGESSGQGEIKKRRNKRKEEKKNTFAQKKIIYRVKLKIGWNKEKVLQKGRIKRKVKKLLHIKDANCRYSSYKATKENARKREGTDDDGCMDLNWNKENKNEMKRVGKNWGKRLYPRKTLV